MNLRPTQRLATMLALSGAAICVSTSWHTARAQVVSGLYIGAGAGGNYLSDLKLRGSPGLGTPGGVVRDNIGAVGVGSIGYGFGNGVRLEVEGDYRYNHVSRVTGTPFPTSASGNERKYGAMANVLFDLDIGEDWIYPYLGVGAGYSRTEFHNVNIRGITAPYGVSVGGGANAFAYQGILGVSLPIAFVPGLSVTAEYRFLGLTGRQALSGTSLVQRPLSGGPLTPGRGNFGIANDFNHDLLIGFRYAFDTAPPPVPGPAPAPAPVVTPARTYLVFFDWDRAELTDRARQIVAEAASASTRVQYTRIEVDGHADLSGTPAYNQRLSLRRAQNVAAELVRLGVPRTAIDIQAFGDTRPLVPTARGVREPQNRRVEIVIR